MHQGFPSVRCLVLLGCLVVPACGDRLDRKPLGPNPPVAVEPPSAPGPVRDEIPPDQLAAVIDAHYRGLGAMERYEYRAASAAFDEVHRRAPGWINGTINLAIALLNLGGEAEEKAKAGQGADQATVQNIETARQLLDEVIQRRPDNAYALFSRGIILESRGENVAANRDFAAVTRIDPRDAHAWYEFGATLTDPAREGMPAGRDQAAQLIDAYTKALQANPYLTTAMYRLRGAYALAGDRVEAGKMLALYTKLNPKRNVAASGEVAALVYGEMGRYAQIIDPFQHSRPPTAAAPAPRFDPPESIEIKLPEGDRWASMADLAGPYAAIGRARSRFGAGVATFDVNRDGLLDLYLTAAVTGPKGPRDALLLNQGNRRFTDATAEYGLPLDRASLGVAASDFDADFQVDLYLTGINNNRLFRQSDHKFIDITGEAKVAVDGTISLTARWLDIDQDGDLDLYVINYAAMSDLETAFTPGAGGRGVANSVFRNDGKPAPVGQRPEDNWAPLATATADLPARSGLSIAFSTAWPSAGVLGAGTARHTALAALDIDDDRDIDLVVTADDQAPGVLLNDRGGNFHAAPLAGWPVTGPVANLLVTHVDKDGLPDLVATAAGDRVIAWRNATKRDGADPTVTGASFPINARDWRSAVTVDLDLDTWADLIGLPAPAPTAGLEWSRNAGLRFENQGLALGPVGGDNRPVNGFAVANLVGDPLPDLILRRDGEPPRLARNLGNGSHWLSLDLSGRWKTSHDQMRTNSEGLGARLALEGRDLFVPYDNTTPEAGLSQSVGPVVLGMGSDLNAPLLRTRWPDGVMQSELNVTADKVLPLVELSRKTGSCPILFTWNGARFVCLGDFAGAAGLGFLEVPGEYHPPDRDEAMLIRPDQLQPVGSIYRLSVVEPMDEVAYLDQLSLDVVDHPPGVAFTPDEHFAFGDPQPTGDLISWTKTISPRAALDHQGRDVLPLILNADRRSVDQFAKIPGWVGYTEDHALILDFGPASGTDDAPVLCLTGWVEYPYSQTNYAAAGAGVVLRAPVLEQRLPDGGWQVIVAGMGHPAGLTRTMTVNLAGKILPVADLVFRINTNMECYWDQAFLAVRDPEALGSIRTTTLPVAQARLRDRGYLREFTPDGLQPALPDYDHVDPMPLARLRGDLTRHGDVARLLQTDDDQLCVMGPGDEVQLEFDGSNLPPLEPGWSRSFVFRSVAYCKDADPFTATSDTIGPLPWRGMKSFPFPSGGDRPLDRRLLGLPPERLPDATRRRSLARFRWGLGPEVGGVRQVRRGREHRGSAGSGR